MATTNIKIGDREWAGPGVQTIGQSGLLKESGETLLAKPFLDSFWFE
jgi:hypothetical protein